MGVRKPIPSPLIPVIDPKTGMMNVVWYDFFADQTRKKLADLPDVSQTTLPTNTQTLKWNSSLSLWVPG
jgi:hypothetical protein